MDNDKLQAQLIAHEGLRLKPYRDSVGKITIGVGRNIEDDGISQEEALLMLQNDINEMVHELSQLHFWGALDGDDARQRVVIDMAFNLGLPRFLTFKTMIGCLEVRDWKGASQAMQNSTWARQVGIRCAILSRMMESGTE